MNNIDNGNRMKASEIWAHKKFESGFKFPKVVCSKSVAFPWRVPRILEIRSTLRPDDFIEYWNMIKIFALTNYL